MTTLELAKVIGRKAVYRINGLGVHVKIVDAKMSYGRVHLHIIPTEGIGDVWADASSISGWQLEDSALNRPPVKINKLLNEVN